MASYLIDGKRTMTGTQVLTFAKKRHDDNNKGRKKPQNVKQAVTFLRLSVRGAGEGSKSHSVEQL